MLAVIRPGFRGGHLDWLVWEVVSDKQQHLFNFQLCQVHEHERNLDRGRFTNFRHEQQEHVATFDVKHHDLDGMTWAHMVTVWVNWIAEHGDGLWSISLDVQNVHEGFIRVSFSDAKTGVIFKLVFG